MAIQEEDIAAVAKARIEGDKKLKELDKQLAEAKKSGGAEAEKVAARIKELEAANEQLAADAKAAGEKLAAAEKAHKEAADRAAKLEKDLASTGKAAAAAGDAEKARAEIEQRLEEKESLLKKNTKKLATLLDENESLEKELKALREGAGAAAADSEKLAALDKRATEAEGKADKALKKAADLAAQLEEAKAAAAKAAPAGDTVPAGEYDAVMKKLDATRLEHATLEEEHAKLAEKLDRMRSSLEDEQRRADEAEQKAGAGGGGGISPDNIVRVTEAFEEVKGVSRGWRDNVQILGDFIEEIRDGVPIPDSLEDTFEAITDTLTALGDKSAEMKQILRRVREVLGGDDD